MGMALEIVSVGGTDDIKDSVLSSRARQGWRVWTHGFVARLDNSECGLLMLDFYDRSLTAKVYEIFILEQFRQRRVASDLLKLAEARAREFGATRLELEAHPLDDRTDISWLRQWYSSKGFDGVSGGRVMAKVLQTGADQSDNGA